MSKLVCIQLISGETVVGSLVKEGKKTVVLDFPIKLANSLDGKSAERPYMFFVKHNLLSPTTRVKYQLTSVITINDVLPIVEQFYAKAKEYLDTNMMNNITTEFEAYIKSIDKSIKDPSSAITIKDIRKMIEEQFDEGLLENVDLSPKKKTIN